MRTHVLIDMLMSTCMLMLILCLYVDDSQAKGGSAKDADGEPVNGTRVDDKNDGHFESLMLRDEAPRDGKRGRSIRS